MHSKHFLILFQPKFNHQHQGKSSIKI
jgi:hypothetical protein